MSDETKELAERIYVGLLLGEGSVEVHSVERNDGSLIYAIDVRPATYIKDEASMADIAEQAITAANVFRDTWLSKAKP
jgi:hypothetical protein